MRTPKGCRIRRAESANTPYCCAAAEEAKERKEDVSGSPLPAACIVNCGEFCPLSVMRLFDAHFLLACFFPLVFFDFLLTILQETWLIEKGLPTPFQATPQMRSQRLRQLDEEMVPWTGCSI